MNRRGVSTRSWTPVVPGPAPEGSAYGMPDYRPSPPPLASGWMGWGEEITVRALAKTTAGPGLELVERPEPSAYLATDVVSEKTAASCRAP